MALFPFFNNWDTYRIMGVLQRIGLVYLVASAIYLHFGPRGRWGWTAILLLGYWALMTLVPVPGFGPGDLSQGRQPGRLHRSGGVGPGAPVARRCL